MEIFRVLLVLFVMSGLLSAQNPQYCGQFCYPPSSPAAAAVHAIVVTNVPIINTSLTSSNVTAANFATGLAQAQTYMNAAIKVGTLTTVNNLIKADWYQIVNATPDGHDLYASMVANGYKGTLADVQAYIASSTVQERTDLTTWAFNYVPSQPSTTGVAGYLNSQLGYLRTLYSNGTSKSAGLGEIPTLTGPQWIHYSAKDCHDWDVSNKVIGVAAFWASLDPATTEFGIAIGFVFVILELGHAIECPNSSGRNFYPRRNFNEKMVG